MQVFYSFLIYAIFFSISVGLYYIFLSLTKKKNIIGFKKKLILFLSMIPLIILFSFRNNVGTDFNTYIHYYDLVSEYTLDLKTIFNNFLEPLWILISYLFISLKIPFWGFLLFISSIFGWFEILILDKYEDKCPNFLCHLLMYIILFALFMNTTRQQLASIIVLYASFFLLDRKKLKFILLVLFASMIHKSSLIALTFPLIEWLADKKKVMMFMNIIIFSSPFWAFLMERPLNYLLKVIIPNSPYIGVEQGMSFGYLFYTIPLILLFIFLCNYSNKKNINLLNKKVRLFFVLYSFQFFCQALGGFFFPLERLSLYFSSFQVVLWPEVLCLFKDDTNYKKIFLCLIIWYLFYYFIMYILLNGNEIYPYHFM